MNIDDDMFIERFFRIVNPGLYYNKSCKLFFTGWEAVNVYTFISFMYDNNYYNRNGVKSDDLREKCPLCWVTVRVYCHMLCPMIINMNSSKEDTFSIKQARFISLTDLGVKIAIMIKEKQEAKRLKNEQSANNK